MLSNAPRHLLALALAAPVIVSPVVDEERHEITLAVKDAVAERRGSAEYIKKGNQRILIARVKDTGNCRSDFDAVHSLAYDRENFIRHIEDEIKNPANRLTVGNFRTKVEYVKGEYVLTYSVTLTPAKSGEVHRVIDMRGTVGCGADAKKFVLEENAKKIPDARRLMEANYPGHKFKAEVDRSEAISPHGLLYHEAALLKGAATE